MSLIDTLPASDVVTSAELRKARDILVRKAISDARNRDMSEASGHYVVADGYALRVKLLDDAIATIEDCLGGILPGC